MLSLYKVELLADFQQYYNLDLSELGDSLSVSRAADLCSQLPSSSRIFCAADPSAKWTTDTWLLSRIDHDLRVLIWQKTEDGRNGENFPEPILPASKTKQPSNRKRKRKQGLTSDEYTKKLGRRRVDG